MKAEIRRLLAEGRTDEEIKARFVAEYGARILVVPPAEGFAATALSCVLSGALSMALHGATPGLDPDEQMIGRWLAAWGDAFLVGMLVAIFVAFRPHWLATYSDRLYLPPPPDEPPPR